jgi:hypothetical protein
MPKILERLVSQLKAKGQPKSNAFAIATSQLQKHGVLKKGTQELTSHGAERQALGNAGRAKERASRDTSHSPSDYKYSPKTNQATLKGYQEGGSVEDTRKIDQQARMTRHRQNRERAGLANDPTFDRPIRSEINRQIVEGGGGNRYNPEGVPRYQAGGIGKAAGPASMPSSPGRAAGSFAVGGPPLGRVGIAGSKKNG